MLIYPVCNQQIMGKFENILGLFFAWRLIIIEQPDRLAIRPETRYDRSSLQPDMAIKSTDFLRKSCFMAIFLYYLYAPCMVIPAD